MPLVLPTVGNHVAFWLHVLMLGVPQSLFSEHEIVTGGRASFKYTLYLKLVSIGSPQIQVDERNPERQHMLEEKGFLPRDYKKLAA